MMGFSAREVLLSVVYSVAYGAAYSLIYKTLEFLINLIFVFPEYLCTQLREEKIISLISIKGKIKGRKNGPIFTFFSTLTYFTGFLLLSYFSLDGDIRLYMLILSSASLYIFNLTFCDFWHKILTTLFDIVFALLFAALRLVILPIKSLAACLIQIFHIKKQK